jgi:hypothetical protein
MARREIVRQQDGFRFVWKPGEARKGARADHVCVDAYKDEELVMEWAYAKVSDTLALQVAFWESQALLQAHEELRKKKGTPASKNNDDNADARFNTFVEGATDSLCRQWKDFSGDDLGEAKKEEISDLIFDFFEGRRP